MHLPGLARVLRSSLLRSVAVAACGLTASFFTGSLRSPDPATFERAGLKLLSSSFFDAFSDPDVQVGPAHLLVSGFLGLARRALGLSLEPLLLVSVHLLIPIAALMVARVLLRQPDGQDHPILELGVGLGTVVFGIPLICYEVGQPADVVVPMLWVIAGVSAARGEGLRSSMWIALAAAIKPSGFLGLPLLFLVPGHREALRLMVLAAGAGLATYAPFVVFGDFAMGRRDWLAFPDSLVAQAFGVLSFGWTWRIAQAVIVVGIGSLFFIGFRKSRELIWAGSLVLVVTRIATDPQVWPSYWTGVEILCLLGLASLAAGPRAGLWTWLSAAGLAWIGLWAGPSQIGAVALIAVATAGCLALRSAQNG